MTKNLLGREASPYLLQHKDNPVHWHPWGPAALAEAQSANKPILLSVGYAACHWCHVMAHESFENPEIAAVMNELFVNIKVDREERPDIDQIYMQALHATGEQGGWPLTMFLTPEGHPIWGGTYFPPAARYGRPGFADVLRVVARIFREEPDTIQNNAGALMSHLAAKPAGTAIALDRPLLDQAASRLLQFMDPDRGGTRGAPKFPQASLLDFLWRSAERTGDGQLRDIVSLTLDNICRGGITDHIGGGFARYSVDDRWLVPHFEKMLYDNAQLLELLTSAWLATHNPLFQSSVAATVGWLDREMAQPGGAFAASLDADSEGHEGRFYVWTPDEVIAVLGDGEGARFCAAYDITPAGNWDGVSIPNRLHADGPAPEFTKARAKLLTARGRRVRPATDDKILADWNGLTIAALAFAGSTFDRPEWIASASRAYSFVDQTMTSGGRLAHAWRDGKSVAGLATDYAAMIKAALALHTATLDRAWVDRAEQLARTVRAHHWDDERPGYFLSADDAQALIVRPRSTTDEATPSATSVMASNLIHLWRLTGDDAYRRDADAIFASASETIGANLFAATGLLSALDFRLRATDVVIVSPPGASPADLVTAVRQNWTSTLVVSLHEDAGRLPAAHPAAGKSAVDGRATAYVCRGETCSLPATEPADLVRLIRN